MCAMKETNKRILIIDDDIDLLMLIERSLLKAGYEVETAVSLPEAEEIMLYYEPHLVLLDINVRGDDGRQLCWKLKKSAQPSGIKVLIMSGFDFSVSRAALFGADELLAKPLQTEYLLHKVAEHLKDPVNEPGSVLSH
jgi:DNA-binding response OmpR family regulator